MFALLLSPLQFLSATEIAITKGCSSANSFDALPDPSAPNPWRTEPGPLKIVAIDTGAGLVELNPDDGGVVVATVLADFNITIQPNEELHVYQSTRLIHVAGSGFDHDVEVSPFLGVDPVVSSRPDLCLKVFVLSSIFSADLGQPCPCLCIEKPQFGSSRLLLLLLLKGEKRYT